MPALANIVVNDAATTPVAHTFSPVTTDGSTARFANRSATTPAGFETLQVEVKQPANRDGAYRVIIGMGKPTEVTVSGVTTVDRVNSGQVSLNFSQKSTAQERKDMLKMLANACLDTAIVSVVTNVEPIY